MVVSNVVTYGAVVTVEPIVVQVPAPAGERWKVMSSDDSDSVATPVSESVPRAVVGTPAIETLLGAVASYFRADWTPMFRPFVQPVQVAVCAGLEPAVG